MLRIENNNQEVMDFVNAKLQRDNEKLFKKIPKKVQDGKEIAPDKYTLLTNENDKLITKSMIVPGVPFAIGLLKAVVGGIAYFPATATPPNEEAAVFFEQARNFGESTANGSVPFFIAGGVLLALPAGIAAISISNKIHKMLTEKNVNKVRLNNAVISLIDDILDKKEDDESLEFAIKFFKRVDLLKNKPEINIELLKYIAYHRVMKKLQIAGKKEGRDVEEAYEQMILFFKEIRESKDTSEEFKNNRFLNIIIDEYDEKIKEEMILGGTTRR